MSLLADVRLGFRTLVKNPGFTAVAVATLAVGIGVNATVFTVTDAVLFKGFPLVSGNDRIRYITLKAPAAASPILTFWIGRLSQSPSTMWPSFTEYRRSSATRAAFRSGWM